MWRQTIIFRLFFSIFSSIFLSFYYKQVTALFSVLYCFVFSTLLFYLFFPFFIFTHFSSSFYSILFSPHLFSPYSLHFSSLPFLYLPLSTPLHHCYHFRYGVEVYCGNVRCTDQGIDEIREEASTFCFLPSCFLLFCLPHFYFYSYSYWNHANTHLFDNRINIHIFIVLCVCHLYYMFVINILLFSLKIVFCIETGNVCLTSFFRIFFPFLLSFPLFFIYHHSSFDFLHIFNFCFFIYFFFFFYSPASRDVFWNSSFSSRNGNIPRNWSLQSVSGTLRENSWFPADKECSSSDVSIEAESEAGCC